MTLETRFSQAVAAATAGLVMAASRAAEACTICFGDPNSPLTKSAEMGVWFLLAVILAVQAGFAIFFFVYFRKRARRFPDPHARLHLVKHT